MAAVHPTINDQITRVQLRLLKQKLESEQERLQRWPDQDKDSLIVDKYNRLEEAVSRRQQLLDKLQRERLLNDELNRPSTFPGLPSIHHHRPRQSDIPQHRFSRRSESQPQFNVEPQRQVIEHHYMSPPRLDPISRLPVGMYQPSHQQLVPTHSLPPIIPQPYVMAAPPFANTLQQAAPPPPNNSRTDMYEMMMIQNAQMHQMIMQQLMMAATLPSAAAAAASSQTTSHHTSAPDQDATKLTIDIRDLIDLKKSSVAASEPAPPSIHHHHYGPAPHYGPQPAVAPGLIDGQLPAAAAAANNQLGGYAYTLPPIQMLPVGQPYVAIEDTAQHSQYTDDQHRHHPSHLHRNYQRQHNPPQGDASYS